MVVLASFLVLGGPSRRGRRDAARKRDEGQGCHEAMKSAAMKTTKAMKAKAAMDAMKIEGDEGQGGHLSWGAAR